MPRRKATLSSDVPSFDEGFCKGWKTDSKLTLQQHAARATLKHLRKEARRFGSLEHISMCSSLRTKKWSATETTRLLVDGNVIGGLGYGAMINRTFNASLIEVDDEACEQTIYIALFGIIILMIRRDFDDVEGEIESIEGFYEMLKDKFFLRLVAKLLNYARREIYWLSSSDSDTENKSGGPADEFVKWVLDGRGQGELPPKVKGDLHLVIEALSARDDIALRTKKPLAKSSTRKPKRKSTQKSRM